MTQKGRKSPVVLVHGILRNSSVFRKMKPYLAQQGWPVYALDMHNHTGFVGLENLAVQLREYITKTFSTEEKINLIGLSMGGLVCRYYLQRLGGVEKVQQFITIGTPHQGTQTAYLLPLTTGVQMRPHSQFLEDLNQDIAVLNQIKCTSIWTPWDFIIIPAISAKMDVGESIKVNIFAHAMLVVDKQSLQVVDQTLNIG